jgi:flagellar biosynthesis GTPase FlhF
MLEKRKANLEEKKHQAEQEEKKRKAKLEEKELEYKKEKEERSEKNARRLQKEKDLLTLKLEEQQMTFQKDKLNRQDASERHKRETEKSKESASIKNKNDQYNNLRKDLVGLFRWLDGWEDDMNEDKRTLLKMKEITYGNDGTSGIMFFTDEISGIICAARDKINVFANKDFTLKELIESEGIYTFFASYVGFVYRNLKINEMETKSITIHYSSTRYSMQQKDADNMGAVQFFSNVKRVPLLDKNDVQIGTRLVFDKVKNAETTVKTWPWQRPGNAFSQEKGERRWGRGQQNY